MPSKKYWANLTNKFLDEHKKKNSIHTVYIQGVKFEIFPGVFSPSISSDTSWFAKVVLLHIQGKDFLEIGAGSGVISCLAEINGAKSVTATDINLKAVQNLKLNRKNLDLRFEVFSGDLFSPINKNSKYDVIFWNHPFNFIETKTPKTDELSLSVFDFEYTSLKKFFKEGKKHLKPNGALLLGTGNIARINLIKKFAAENRYDMKLEAKTIVPIYENKSSKMDLRLYSFKFNEAL